MITPRATRLVRVPDPQGLRASLAQLTLSLHLNARGTAILVPTRSAGEELRRSLEAAAFEAGRDALLLPDIVTRRELYLRLHAGIADAPALLTEQEREVLLRRAARGAIAAGAIPPFRLRPGLVVQLLDFYDELRRREATLDDLERHVAIRLAESADSDRGAERLLRQTEFLLAAFAQFEQASTATGRMDEHGLRSLLLAGTPQGIYDHVIVTVQDQAGDARGLFASDFDLLARLPGLRHLTVVATEAVLGAGFHERLHALLPELAETREVRAAPRPVLVAPESREPDQRWFVSRDREEELADFVRRLKIRSASSGPSVPPLERIGIVFQRPLPYLYLARQVFADGGVPYEAFDALPLSAEPFSATIDVVFSFLLSEGNRTSIVELLRSPHLSFSAAVDAREVAGLDARLRDDRYPGGWDRLAALASTVGGGRTGDAALRTAHAAAQAIRPVLEARAASDQFASLIGFLHQHERVAPAGSDWAERHLRAREAVLAALEAVRDAHRLHDDQPLDGPELSGTVRRWIDAQTFAPRTGAGGVRLLDAASAPYADLDELHIVGVVERDWPESSRRSIFYPASLLTPLGWPGDASRMTAARAAFHDLLLAPVNRISVSLFTLEDDSLVAGSPFLEEIEAAALSLERLPAQPNARVFVHEALQDGVADPHLAGVLEPAAGWLALRAGRSSPDDRRFHGSTPPRAPQTYAISYLERYLECPFKYFAARILRLPEERPEEAGLTPIERGHLLHGVFETFFRQWDAAGYGTITIANADRALEMFAAVAEALIEALPEADRALERTHLLGSAAAPGLAERAFAFEIEQGGEVIERLLEHELEGEFAFVADGSKRRIRLKAKADRLDLMADGTIRVIDYKLGRAPKASRSLQLPIYGVIAQQALEGRHGRQWTVGAAGYVAFKEKEAFVSLAGRSSAIAPALAEGQARLIAAVDGIERGEFPVRPDEPYRCQWCAYAGVCRKDYVGDD